MVVVGAGVAGIVAADQLRRSGYDVRVLEARHRLGGRVHTWLGWPGSPLDLGASWIHGYAAGNPLTPIAHRAGAVLVASSYDSGRVHVDHRLSAAGVQAHSRRWHRIVAEAKTHARHRPRDESLARAVRRQVSGLQLNPYEEDELAFHLNAHYTTEWGEDPDALSARTIDEGKEYGRTGEDAFFPNGYDQVPAYLARHLDIEYETVVRGLVLRDGGVRVETARGAIQARAVVVTVPLGVLKDEAIDFVPALPVRHSEAIDRLGVGVLSKTFLLFEKPFWPEDEDWQEFLGPRHGVWAEWFSLAKAGPPVLVGVPRWRPSPRARDGPESRGPSRGPPSTALHVRPRRAGAAGREVHCMVTRPVHPRLLLHERHRLDESGPSHSQRTCRRTDLPRRRGHRAGLQLNGARRLPHRTPGGPPGRRRARRRGSLPVIVARDAGGPEWAFPEGDRGVILGHRPNASWA